MANDPKCPDPNVLVSLVDGDLSKEQEQHVRRHLEANCPTCEDWISLLRATKQIASVPLHDPPPEVTEAAIRIAEDSESVAVLEPDLDLLAPATAGVRSLAPCESTLVWTEDVFRIEVKVESTDSDRLVLIGQLNARTESCVPVSDRELSLRTDTLSDPISMRTNEVGEFLTFLPPCTHGEILVSLHPGCKTLLKFDL